jgi:hypothetical protein
VTVVLGALVVVLAVLSVPIGIAARKPFAGLVLFGVLAAALGWLITRRQPGNRIGLLLVGFGALLVFYEDAAGYAVADYHVHRGTLPLGFPAVLIASELWSALLLMPPLIILLFPDGRLPPRWRLVCRAYLAVCALITAILLGGGASQMSGTRIVVQRNGQNVNNPFPGGVLGLVLLTGIIAVAVFWLSFVARQVLSWRRAAGERRAQLKWLMAGSVATVVGLAGTFLLQSLTVLDNICLALGIFSLPVCISFAILKYRLYDIDRIISRTLAYTIVTGLLVGVYAGLVLLATRALPVSLSSPVAVACATLVAAALFSPLRRRVQAIVDRRFNRARYDADRTIAAFAARLAGVTDLDALQNDLASVVQQALEPSHVRLWMSESG